MNEAELEQIARRRVKAKRDFAVHLTLYVFVNAMLILIWYVTGRGYPWFLWPLVGWGMGVVGNALSVAMEVFMPEERSIQREMRRLTR